MLYGLYLSAQGAQARATQLEVTSNNLANAGTNSFKRDLALFQSHRTFDREYGGIGSPPGGLNEQTGGVTIAGTLTDHTQGSLVKTAGAFDLAIAGPGFFQVRNGGETVLTRDGRFSKNAIGDLVTADGGFPVLSAEGMPVRCNPDAVGIDISEDGLISERLPTGESVPVARLAVVLPESPNSLEKLGNNQYRAVGQVAPAARDTRVLQGFLESSGVNPVHETMQMIEASRAFETNVNMLKLQDESLARLLTAGRP